jgi:hypothetical protein
VPARRFVVPATQVDSSAICARIFGQEYASLLAKAAEVAAQRERKAAARA